MAKWRRQYYESIAAVFVRRLYWHGVAFPALKVYRGVPAVDEQEYGYL